MPSSGLLGKGAVASADGGSNITVTVRVRPLSGKERARQSHSCLEVKGNEVNTKDPDEKVVLRSPGASGSSTD